MKAREARDGWHGQRGGFKKYALALDPALWLYQFVPPWGLNNRPMQFVYHFSDNSKLLSAGRGKHHYLVILEEKT